jgi:hypothetical protein
VGLDLADLTMTDLRLKSSIFWDITPCSPLKVNQYFEEKFRLHPQGRRISQAKAPGIKPGGKQSSDFLLGLFFDSEDGGEMFLRNVS